MVNLRLSLSVNKLWFLVRRCWESASDGTRIWLYGGRLRFKFMPFLACFGHLSIKSRLRLYRERSDRKHFRILPDPIMSANTAYTDNYFHWFFFIKGDMYAHLTVLSIGTFGDYFGNFRMYRNGRVATLALLYAV